MKTKLSSVFAVLLMGLTPAVYAQTWGAASTPVTWVPANSLAAPTGDIYFSIVSGGPAFTLSVAGSGFVPSSKVQWNLAVRDTTYISPAELHAAIPAADIVSSGVFAITLDNPAPSGDPDAQDPAGIGITPIGIMAVANPLPSISRLSPASATAGDPAVALVIEGDGFVKDVTYVQWNGKKLHPDFISTNKIGVTIPAADLASEGIINLVVSNPHPGGGETDSRSFSITSGSPVLAELYFPHLVNMSSDSPDDQKTRNTGIAIANLSGKTPEITLRAFDRQGNAFAGPRIINPVSLSLSSVEQRAVTGTQVFGNGISEQNSIGWMKLESSERQIAGFFLAFDDSLSTLDGASVSSNTLTSIVFPEIEDQGFNQYHIANPSSTSATIRFELRKSDGSPRTAVVRKVNAGGAIAEVFSDLFPGVTADSPDYILVTSDRGTVPFSNFGRLSQDDAGLNGQDATKGSATLYCPQYVVGGNAYRTTLSVVNLDPVHANVTFRLIGDNGVQIGSLQTLQVPARGKLHAVDQEFFVSGADLVQGYVEIKSDGARLTGSVAFTDPERKSFASALPLVFALQNQFVFGQVASDRTYFTGIAMLNPSDQDVTATIELFNAAGQRVSSKTDVLPARQRISKLLTQYFPGLTGQDISGGFIKVTSDRGLASFALFGTQNLSALSAVPAQVVPWFIRSASGGNRGCRQLPWHFSLLAASRLVFPCGSPDLAQALSKAGRSIT